MSTTAVDVRDVSKRFQLAKERYTSLKERVIHGGRVKREDLWALRDVNFTVAEGETVGILGRNGSGKSTLLKCICGVLQPTSGEVIVRGNLAGLLELGAGFQQELSGRDNIYLNGSMLGMSKRDVDKIFDEIVAFAELEQFIDHQVKFYSSGMYVRLGFAVAVNMDPHVLVIDEVLSVGDERFQRKCMERIKTFQEEGRTILFVTHSPDQVRSICDRAVVLDEGHLVAEGPPGEAVRIFREHLLEASDVLNQGSVGQTPAVSEEAVADEAAARSFVQEGLRPVRFTDVRVYYPGMEERPYLLTGDALHIRLHFNATTVTKGVVFVLELRDTGGNCILRTDTDILGQQIDVPEGTGAIEFRFATFPFLDGAYEVHAGIQSRLGGVVFDWREPAASFEVMHPGRSTGIVDLPVQALMVEGPMAEVAAGVSQTVVPS
ncbi:MAG TPA: ABC transporter ATP-binding protein [Acidimicrobiales bacterium]|nr:ABC transporter ATP-binding protein [Acidimicrobiales bacterium]